MRSCLYSRTMINYPLICSFYPILGCNMQVWNTVTHFFLDCYNKGREIFDFPSYVIDTRNTKAVFREAEFRERYFHFIPRADIYSWNCSGLNRLAFKCDTAWKTISTAEEGSKEKELLSKHFGLILICLQEQASIPSSLQNNIHVKAQRLANSILPYSFHHFSYDDLKTTTVSKYGNIPIITDPQIFANCLINELEQCFIEEKRQKEALECIQQLKKLIENNFP